MRDREDVVVRGGCKNRSSGGRLEGKRMVRRLEGIVEGRGELRDPCGVGNGDGGFVRAMKEEGREGGRGERQRCELS